MSLFGHRLNYRKEKIRHEPFDKKKIELLLMLKIVSDRYKCDINYRFK